MYICKRTVRAEEEETEKKTGKRNVCNMKAKEGIFPLYPYLQGFSPLSPPSNILKHTKVKIKDILHPLNS
jgi:hypothetical protein